MLRQRRLLRLARKVGASIITEIYLICPVFAVLSAAVRRPPPRGASLSAAALPTPSAVAATALARLTRAVTAAAADPWSAPTRVRPSHHRHHRRRRAREYNTTRP